MKMKKILLGLLIVQILCFSLILSTSAASGETKLSFAMESSDSVVKAGDTFTVAISIDQNVGFLVAIPHIQYDSELLTYKGFALAEDAFTEAVMVKPSDSDVNTLVLTIGTLPVSEVYSETGTLLVLTFEAKADLADDVKTTLDLTIEYTGAIGPHTPVDKDDKTTWEFWKNSELSGDSMDIQLISKDHEHTVVEDKAIDATCTENGLTAGEHCSVCEEVLKAQEVVEAKGHTVVKDAAVAAGCLTAGKTEGEHCSVCEEVLKAQEEVPALGHDIEKDPAVAPTCTEVGKTEGEHCKRCDYKVAQSDVPATGHKIEKDAAKDATCTETGLTAGEHCTVCDYKVAQDVVPAKGHTLTKDNAVAATCTTEGKTEGEHCTVCNTITKAQDVVPKTAHDLNEWVEEKAATKKAEGIRSRSCRNCDYKEQEPIEKLPSDNTLLIVIIVIVIVLVLAGAGVVVFIVIKRKKANASTPDADEPEADAADEAADEPATETEGAEEATGETDEAPADQE